MPHSPVTAISVGAQLLLLARAGAGADLMASYARPPEVQDLGNALLKAVQAGAGAPVLEQFARELVAAEVGAGPVAQAAADLKAGPSALAASVGSLRADLEAMGKSLRADIASLAADVKAMPARRRPVAVKQKVLKLTLAPNLRTTVCVQQDLHDRYLAAFGKDSMAELLAQHRGKVPLGQKRSGMVQAAMVAALEAREPGGNVVNLRR